MSACVYCRASCSDGARFCGSCGAPQPYAPPPASPYAPPYAGQQRYPPGLPYPAAAPRRGRKVLGMVAILVLLVALGGGAFAAYRLNLIPGVVGGPLSGETGVAFVGEDGGPVDPGSFGVPAAAGAAAPSWTSATPFIAPEVDRNALDADLGAIAAAFATKDPAKVSAWVHPGVREQLMPVFEADASRLGEVAALLATRKPVFVTRVYAEYEVTDRSGTFTVVYQKSGDHWTLSGL